MLEEESLNQDDVDRRCPAHDAGGGSPASMQGLGTAPLLPFPRNSSFSQTLAWDRIKQLSFLFLGPGVQSFGSMSDRQGHGISSYQEREEKV